MANLTSVTVTNGVPTAGTGTVSTIDALMADGGQATVGVTTGTAVITDATGTLQQYLRGLVKLIAAGITASVTQSGSWVLSAGTAVIGKIMLQDGSGNALTSTSGALDINIKSGVNTNGRALPSGSAPVVQASQKYVTVAASQTATALVGSGSGATGDWLDGVLVIPASTSPGNVLLLDNTTSITIFAGGASSVTNLIPFFIPIGAISQSGAWKITTGASVSVIAMGNFT